MEHPKNVLEHPKNVLEHPKNVLEHPKNVLERPFQDKNNLRNVEKMLMLDNFDFKSDFQN